MSYACNRTFSTLFSLLLLSLLFACSNGGGRPSNENDNGSGNQHDGVDVVPQKIGGIILHIICDPSGADSYLQENLDALVALIDKLPENERIMLDRTPVNRIPGHFSNVAQVIAVRSKVNVTQLLIEQRDNGYLTATLLNRYPPERIVFQQVVQGLMSFPFLSEVTPTVTAPFCMLSPAIQTVSQWRSALSLVTGNGRDATIFGVAPVDLLKGDERCLQPSTLTGSEQFLPYVVLPKKHIKLSSFTGVKIVGSLEHYTLVLDYYK